MICEMNDVKKLLSEEKHILLKKECSRETIQHEFYRVVNEDGIQCYHLKYTKLEDGTVKLKDFPAIIIENFNPDDIDKELNIMVSAIEDYVLNAGYELNIKE